MASVLDQIAGGEPGYLLGNYLIGVMIPLPLKWGGLCLYSKVVSLARPANFPTLWDA